MKTLSADVEPGDSYSLADGMPVNPIVARNLIAAGWLVPSADGLLPGAAQTYRTAS